MVLRRRSRSSTSQSRRPRLNRMPRLPIRSLGNSATVFLSSLYLPEGRTSPRRHAGERYSNNGRSPIDERVARCLPLRFAPGRAKFVAQKETPRPRPSRKYRERDKPAYDSSRPIARMNARITAILAVTLLGTTFSATPAQTTHPASLPAPPAAIPPLTRQSIDEEHPSTEPTEITPQRKVAELSKQAIAQLEAHHPEQAIVTLQAALAIDPNDPTNLYNLACARLGSTNPTTRSTTCLNLSWPVSPISSTSSATRTWTAFASSRPMCS